MTKPKGEKSSRPLRRAMNHETAVQYPDQYQNESLFPDKGEAGQTEKVRVLVPLTKETYEYLKKEAERNATTASAFMSIAIQEWVDNRRSGRFDNASMKELLDKVNMRLK